MVGAGRRPRLLHRKEQAGEVCLSAQKVLHDNLIQYCMAEDIQEAYAVVRQLAVESWRLAVAPAVAEMLLAVGKRRLAVGKRRLAVEGQLMGLALAAAEMLLAVGKRWRAVEGQLTGVGMLLALGKRLMVAGVPVAGTKLQPVSNLVS